ncbi:predicted protein [Chaetoceros tenuissimus]|uniref:Uncharacterized protein n=1 Tax=Chaetoceros tenuissimus TaxID=426638 RepID=A0AAD3CZQ4_9STRA|nr:predicted protein [Chaetoceros tenuissimus]
MSSNVLKQLRNETSLDVAIIGARKITSTQNINTSIVLDNTVDLKETIGTVLGGLGIFIILLLYIWWERRDYIKREEKALQETRKEEMKRKLLKDNMNIKICEIMPTLHIDDEEAQHQQKAIFKSHEQQDGDEYCSTTDDSLDDQSQSAAIDQSRSHSNKTQLQGVMCPICHEEFQDGDELASSKNEACCGVIQHFTASLFYLG